MKSFLNIIYVLTLCIVLAACSDENTQNAEETADEDTQSGINTVTYESEFGPVEIPENPERIVALTYGPNLASLDVDMAGVDEWSKRNPLFEEDLNDVPQVTEAEPETILAEAPDLIIAGANMENIEELEKIAPTVTYTWGKLDYLEQQIEIGKLVGKEDEAREWAEDFEQRAAAIGEEIKEIHGDDVTVSVFETDGDSFYLFGDAWGRGTEILFQAMDLNMPENAAEAVEGNGYYDLSQEVLPEYAGDFIVLSRSDDTDLTFTEDETWKSIPAVQNDRVIEINTDATSYSDPTTLEYLLEIYEEALTK